MLTSIHLGAFKAFKEVDIELRPLTVFAGVNSVGKSSLIQSLAMLHQSIADNISNTHFCLSGLNVELGVVEDIANTNFSRGPFQIGISNKHVKCLWKAGSAEKRHSPIAAITEISVLHNEHDLYWSRSSHEDLSRLIPIKWIKERNISDFSLELDNIKYISSERIGPRDVYPALTNPRFRSVGNRGQYCASFLSEAGDDPSKIFASDSEITIRKVVDDYINSFFPGFSIEPRKIENTDLMSLLVIDPSNNKHRIQNVGFGIGHALPIITQCIGAKKGDILLIESPESFLHPGAQSKMGQFLAMAASRGIQIITETHSDHVLNGIRVATASRKIESDAVCINFISNSRDQEQPQCEQIYLTENGRMSSWPEGFFDQIEQDLFSLP